MKNKILILVALCVSLTSFAQSKFASASDSSDCLTQSYLYQEAYKQKDFTSAYEPWLILFEKYPFSHKNVFIRGYNILKFKINEASDSDSADYYIDQLLSMWDKRAEYFGEKSYCLYKKARDMQTYRKQETFRIYEIFKEAMEIGDFKQEALSLPFFYFESAMNAEKDNLISKEDVLDAYNKANSTLEDLYKLNPQDSNLGNTIEQLDLAFQNSIYCDDIIMVYEKNQDNPETAYLMAKTYAERETYDKVLECLPDNVVDSISNLKIKENAYLLIAQACMMTKKYSQGRTAAYKALELNPAKGVAYILIGNMYAISAPTCGSDAELSRNACYWAAVDKFKKAKTVDPSLAETADKLIAAYSAFFPSKQDIFIAGFTVGDFYKVPCWIQELTIIREK